MQWEPDRLVEPGLRVLICGLNPSMFTARTGIPYGRPGNRFWPAALEAGLVTKDRDPMHALKIDRVGFTDLVTRPTVSASALSRDEFVAGFARVSELVERFSPNVTCFVGLTGWRAVIDRHATAGPREVAGHPAYLMPNTSGLNAHSQHADFVAHLRAVVAMGRRE
jgi:TDG/mug DNA glycosylase family protein